MSTDTAVAAAPAATKLKSFGLDMDYHESTHSRNIRTMSTRHLVSNRHDDLLRSGSTHQLLNRPYNATTAAATVPSLLELPRPPPGGAPPAPPGAAASMASAEDEQSDSEESDFSGGSFCDASGDCAADREYLRKDLGASLHDDELDFDSGDEAGNDLIADVKNRMKLEEAAAAEAAS